MENKRKITKNQAAEFYRDLCGTVYGDSRKSGGGIMSAEMIAEHMRITTETAEEFLKNFHDLIEQAGDLI